MDSAAYYIMVALLGAGAAYGLASKGKARPGVSSVQIKVLIAWSAVMGICLVLFLAVVLTSQNPAHH